MSYQHPPPETYRCIFPCTRTFTSRANLVRHINASPICQQRKRDGPILFPLNFESSEESSPPSSSDSSDSNDDSDPETGSTSNSVHTDPPIVEEFDAPFELDVNMDMDMDMEGMDEQPASDIEEEPEHQFNPPVVPRARGPSVDIIESELFTENYAKAAWVVAQKKSYFSRAAEEQMKKENLFHPFKNKEECQEAQWLHNNQLSQRKITAYCQLPSNIRRDLSFKNGPAFHKQLKDLPRSRLFWRSEPIKPDSGTVISPVTLLYHNPIDAVKSLFDRPSLADHMEYRPRRVWTSKREAERERVFNEIMTGEWAWNTQAKLPEGATLVPVLMGSDKTHLTVFAGDKKAWPVYLSIGNIKFQHRAKPTHQCWLLIAYVPIAHWEGPNTLHGTLQARLFHQCLKQVTQSLVEAGNQGIKITDSVGDVRHCFLRLAGYLGDLPEQQLINLCLMNGCPTTTARFHDLGNKRPSKLRTRAWILEKIALVKTQLRARGAHPEDVSVYKGAALAQGLSGVDKPFWEDLPGFQPELSMCPDILHGIHRFFRDHILQWTTVVMGKEELDRRLSAVQPMIGMRHFGEGISGLSQWTGIEDRELQAYFVATVAQADGLKPQAQSCLRAFADFAQLVQYRTHTPTTIGYLEDALSKFHDNKDSFITNGGRQLNHFKIPKIAVFSSFPRVISQLGSLPQFSTEITETNHKQNAKEAYRATNHKDYAVQMCRHLDRHANLLFTQELAEWDEKKRVEHTVEKHLEGFSEEYRRRNYGFLKSFELKQLEELKQLVPVTGKRRGRPPGKYQGSIGCTYSRAGLGRIWHNKKPAYSATVSQISCLYRLPLFRRSVISYWEDYIAGMVQRGEAVPPHEPVSANTLIDVWEQFRIERPSVADEDELAPARTVQAFPPSQDWPHGLCDVVLLHGEDNTLTSGIEGYKIVQVRVVFKIATKDQTHPLHNLPLIFVEFFTDPQRKLESINMFVVQRQFFADADQKCGVEELETVARLIQLIPKFGLEMDPDMTAKNSLAFQPDDKPRQPYLVNSFADKEIFQAVY